MTRVAYGAPLIQEGDGQQGVRFDGNTPETPSPGKANTVEDSPEFRHKHSTLPKIAWESEALRVGMVSDNPTAGSTNITIGSSPIAVKFDPTMRWWVPTNRIPGSSNSSRIDKSWCESHDADELFFNSFKVNL